MQAKCQSCRHYCTNLLIRIHFHFADNLFNWKHPKAFPWRYINLCVDGLSLGKIRVSAFVEDSMYALKHLDQLRHIAVVGDSKLEKALIEFDNKVFGQLYCDDGGRPLSQ